MEYMPVIVFGRFVPLFWKQLLAYTPFCIAESFICCSLGYLPLENAKKLDGHAWAHSVFVNTVKTTFSLWKSGVFSQNGLFCSSLWPQTQVFGSNKFKRIVGSGIGPKQKMGLKIFSESVSPFLGRHSLNGLGLQLLPGTQHDHLVRLY